MIFHENRLLADDSHEISYLIFFRKLKKMSQKLSSAAVVMTLYGLMTVFVFSVKDVNLEKDTPLYRHRKSRHIVRDEELRESRREEDQKRFYYNYQYR